MGARIVVVPPSAETAEIAQDLAPAGFDLVLARDSAAIDAAIGGAEFLVCYPNVKIPDAFFRAAPRLKLVQLLSAGYDDVDLDGGAPRQGAGLQQRRRQRHLGRRACADADARGVAPGGLAARQRVGRALARQRSGAAHVRDVRQDARHRRARHHRQEGGAAGARLRHAGAVLRHRAAERGRGGRARRALSPAATSCCEPPTSCRCMCRSTTQHAA